MNTETKRVMASVVTIEEIKAIPDADKICAYRTAGWWVVDTIDKYNVGDYVVYVAIDAWVPHELAPFLSKGHEPREYNGVKGERLKTAKLRGQLSQGLLLPVDQVNGQKFISGYFLDDPVGVMVFVEEGDDVSDALGIQKWEAPIPAQLAGIMKGAFPTEVPKTDEERIQNLTRDWDNLTQRTYEVTEKLEGSSMTVGRVDGEFIVCSRNVNLEETPDNTMWKLARRHSIEEKMINDAADNLVFQGEVIGESVQGNHYNLKGQEFYVFAVYDIIAGAYLDPEDRFNVCKWYGLKHVPVVETKMSLQGKTVEEVLEMADGTSQINPNKLREGLVFKAHDESQEHWKAVSNKYLLKTGT